MMDIDWIPTFIGDSRIDKSILRILSKCESKLEIMFFLGIAYYLHCNYEEVDYPYFNIDTVEGQEGIHISEPYAGGRDGNGLSSLLVVPQYRSSEKPIRHDFGFFYGESNAGGPWHFYVAVEIEGYGVHRSRRELDKARYRGLSYKVIPVYEEITEPHNWYSIIEDFWEKDLIEEIERQNAIERENNHLF